jgi:phage shock protein PspC (stress-responsive transcriptional regulator)
MAGMNGGNRTKILARSQKGRMVAGICAGIADYSGLDVTLVRVIVAVVSVLTGGTGALAYLAAWLLLPGEGGKNSIAQDIFGKQNA